ncbi:hypothetical protein [Shewanella mangrovi]|nr:hypothetical protein [Shewanella mangrovi]
MKQFYFTQDWYQTHRTHGSYTGEFTDADYAAFDLPLVDEEEMSAEDYQYRDIYDS